MTTDLATRDSVLCLELAREHRVPTFLASAAHHVYEMRSRAGSRRRTVSSSHHGIRITVRVSSRSADSSDTAPECPATRRHRSSDAVTDWPV